MKILITGASGFLGRHLVKRLADEGHSIKALVRQTSRIDHLKKLNVDIVFGDLKDAASFESAVKESEIIYHLGATTHGTPLDFEESTIKGTQQLLQAALNAKVKKFIHISSIVVYKTYNLKNVWNGEQGIVQFTLQDYYQMIQNGFQ